MLNYIIFIFVGLFSGVLAGLMGIGGGSILVPTFMFSLSKNIPYQYLSHVSIATSTAVILFTASFSSLSHFKHKVIDYKILSYMSIGVVIGSLLTGTFIFTNLSSKTVNIIFITFLSLIALQTIFKKKVIRTTRYELHPVLFTIVGIIIASISSIIGVGGGFLTVPFLLSLGLPIHSAIATSAALGLPIALSSTIAYTQHHIPVAYTLGLIYWPAVLIVSPLSSSMSIIGSRLAYSLDTEKLKRIYGYFLMAMCFILLIRLILAS